MKVKNINQQMEVYKELGEEKDSKNESKPEEPKKSFYFVVRQPFDNYKKGDHVIDANEIERIEKQRLLGLVMKVNIRN
ncbi:MAG TPA: hypothetical protein VGW78_07465 [Candidatus Babeliales bacterium]|jgi:hypothetical protein|nr:hypothetical protein [Candidatus Babeliales bacterium]